MKQYPGYKVLVIGASAGGIQAVTTILRGLGSDFPLPVVVAQHIGPTPLGFFHEFLSRESRLHAKDAEDKEPMKPGWVFLAPANYHLLIEDDLSLSLTVDQKVNYSRPSIDVLFESAAFALGSEVIAAICTGANADGSKGLKKISEFGGTCLIQDPAEAEVETMPAAALKEVSDAKVLKINSMAPYIRSLLRI